MITRCAGRLTPAARVDVATRTLQIVGEEGIGWWHGCEPRRQKGVSDVWVRSGGARCCTYAFRFTAWYGIDGTVSIEKGNNEQRGPTRGLSIPGLQDVPLVVHNVHPTQQNNAPCYLTGRYLWVPVYLQIDRRQRKQCNVSSFLNSPTLLGPRATLPRDELLWETATTAITATTATKDGSWAIGGRDAAVGGSINTALVRNSGSRQQKPIISPT